MHAALRAFGAPLQDLSIEDLIQPNLVDQIRVVPRRINLLTSLTGLEFVSAWDGWVESTLGDVKCAFIGKDALIRNKRAVGRPRDLADIDELGG